MKPSDLYQQRVSQATFVPDAEQLEVMRQLDHLQADLQRTLARRSILRHQLKRMISGRTPPVTGVYLWGGVGRGKTWMMDLFFEALLFPEKLRLHFHHFMRAVHDQLALLHGQQNPLKLIARNFGKHYRVLCLDEFHVSDITDAMLLYGLLDALFNEGVSLVATSNQAPDRLYENGLQRQRFLPAIDLIREHTRVVRVGGETDHRLRLLEKADTWYPTDTHSDRRLRRRFLELAPCEPGEQVQLRINYRNLEARMCADDVAWFDFDTLCNGPRATADYMEIARRFHTLFLSDIPVMTEAMDDQAQRFINMIDEFYDRNIKLVASAAAAPAELYSGRQLKIPFERTASRLEEMRSHEYLRRPHKP